MKRSEFFKKSILGAIAIWKAPELLEAVKPTDIVESTDGVLNYISNNYGDYSGKFTYLEYLQSVHRTFDIDLTEQILAELDLGSHKEQEKLLQNTRRLAWQTKPIKPQMNLT